MGSPMIKKGPSRARKRLQASSSQKIVVLVPNDNKRMGLNPRTSTCGLQLHNYSLHTDTMSKQNTNVTISDANTVMKELKSRMKNMAIPQATTYCVNKSNICDDVNIWGLNNNAYKLVRNGITWVIGYKSGIDQCMTQQSSIVTCNANIDRVNDTGITPPGL